MIAHLMLFHLLLHPEGENSELGSLRAEEYIFRVLVGQDLLMTKVSEEEKTQRAQVINKTVGHIPEPRMPFTYTNPGIRMPILPCDVNMMANYTRFDHRDCLRHRN